MNKERRILKKAVVVEDDKRGLKVFYRLKVPCILRFVDYIDAIVETDDVI